MNSRRNLNEAIEDLEARYIRERPLSRIHKETACAYLPNGITRSALAFDPFPLCLKAAYDSEILDVDGHEYDDFSNDGTAGFYGHSHPIIVSEIEEAVKAGLSFGALHEYEKQLAQVICSRIASIDRVRFCSSGTEANLIATNLAKATTGRPYVVAMHGCYHGSILNFVSVDAPMNVERDKFKIAEYNDIDSVRQIFCSHPDQVAAIILEPLMGNAGGILANQQFLRDLRALSNQTGALLIFDEVQTSRLAVGGYQSVVDISPDLTTLGKSVGGGLAFGAFGGRAEIMDRIDAGGQNGIRHSGTFNNSVLTMRAGHAGLTRIATKEMLLRVNQLSKDLRDLLQIAADKAGVEFCSLGFGSIIATHFQSGKPRTIHEIATSEKIRKLFHLHQMLKGFYLPRRGIINLSVATTEQQCQRFVDGFAEFVAEFGYLLGHRDERC